MRLIGRLTAYCALCLLMACGFIATSKAQVYPTTNPTYIPSAVLPVVAMTTTGDQYFVLQNGNSFSVRFSGSHGSLVAAVRVSNDPVSVAAASATWTTIPVYLAGGGQPTSSITANGLYVANVAGYTRVNVHVTTMASGTLNVNMAGSFQTPVPVVAYADPCQSPFVQKSSAKINVGATTTTKIVDVSGSTAIYVCSFSFSLAGTTPTFKFVSGTNASADCDTGAADQSGLYAPLTGSTIGLSGQGTVLQTPASKQLCGTTTGTSSSAQGVLNYVQQ